MKTTVIHELESAEVRQLLDGKDLTITEADGSQIIIRNPIPARLHAQPAKLEAPTLEEFDRAVGGGIARPEPAAAPEKKRRKYTRRAKANIAPKIKKPKRAPKLAAVKNGFPCPDCNFVATTKSGLGGHKGKRHGRPRVIDKETVPVKRTAVAPRGEGRSLDRSGQPREIEANRCDACNHRDMAHNETGCCMPDCPCRQFENAA